MAVTVRALSQYPKRRLSVRSRKVSKPRDRYFKLSYRFEIWQAHRQHCCRGACQISKRCDNLNYQSRGFETSRDLTIRRLIRYWNGAQVPLLTVADRSNLESKVLEANVGHAQSQPIESRCRDAPCWPHEPCYLELRDIVMQKCIRWLG